MWRRGVNNYKNILDGYPCPNPLCSDGSVRVASDVDCVVVSGLEIGQTDHEGCDWCDGSGRVTIESWDTCPDCGGSGVVEELAVPVSENQLKLLID